MQHKLLRISKNFTYNIANYIIYMYMYIRKSYVYIAMILYVHRQVYNFMHVATYLPFYGIFHCTVYILTHTYPSLGHFQLVIQLALLIYSLQILLKGSYIATHILMLVLILDGAGITFSSSQEELCTWEVLMHY